MALKIRLTRMGSTHRPFYRLVVADSRARRDGRVVDTLGYYNPMPEQPEIKVDEQKALGWLQKGAQTSETARSLLKRTGVWQRFQFLKQGMPEEKIDAEIARILGRQEATPAREAPAAGAETAPEPEADAPGEGESTGSTQNGPSCEGSSAGEASSSEPVPASQEPVAASESARDQADSEESKPGGE